MNGVELLIRRDETASAPRAFQQIVREPLSRVLPPSGAGERVGGVDHYVVSVRVDGVVLRVFAPRHEGPYEVEDLACADRVDYRI